MTNKVPYVMIPLEEYRSLLVAADTLYALDVGGVDNWSWYYDSIEDYLKQAVENCSPEDLEEYLEAHDKFIEDLSIEDFINISLRDLELHFPETE